MLMSHVKMSYIDDFNALVVDFEGTMANQVPRKHILAEE